MLEIKNLTKRFNKKKVINNLSIQITPGEKATIIGPSGSGKSTILKLILGLIPADNGKVIINGNEMTTLSKEEKYTIRKNIGLLFQSSALFDSMTVEENVAFPLTESPNTFTRRQLTKKVNTALDLVGMKHFNHRYPSELSGGQQKRVALARAIINQPKILLYDEPTTGLDPILSTSIEDLIVNISDTLQTTSVVVTHQLSTIYRTSDNIYYLHEGNLLPPETPDSINQTKDPIINAFITGKTHGN